MIELARNSISGVTVQLTVEETIQGIGGYPVIRFGNVLIESKMVQEVDTLQFIKAIAASKTVEEFCDKIKGVWCYDEYVILIKSYALDCMTGGGIIDENEHNEKIIEQIDHYGELLKDNTLSPKSQTLARARIYDLHQQLEMID